MTRPDETKRICPRCPRCNKRQANWIEGNASFTCRDEHCKTEFEIIDGRVLIVEPVRFQYVIHPSLTTANQK